MTLAITLQGRRSIWAAADGRLSGAAGPVADDSVKLARIGATDGTVLLTYAGIGRSSLGMSVSDWVVRALRGAERTVETYLLVLSEFARTYFQASLSSVPAGSAVHIFMASAYVAGEVRLYRIYVFLEVGRSDITIQRFRHLPTGADRVPRIGLVGSGHSHLARDLAWARPLLRLLTAHEKGRVSANVVSDTLARCIQQVHPLDATVGPNCVVAWGYADVAGGAHQFYRDGNRSEAWGTLRSLQSGIDMQLLIEPLIKKFHNSTGWNLDGTGWNLDADVENQRLAAIDWSSKPEFK